MSDPRLNDWVPAPLPEPRTTPVDALLDGLERLIASGRQCYSIRVWDEVARFANELPPDAVAQLRSLIRTLTAERDQAAHWLHALTESDRALDKAQPRRTPEETAALSAALRVDRERERILRDDPQASSAEFCNAKDALHKALDAIPEARRAELMEGPSDG